MSGACGPVDSADTIGCVTVLALIAGTVSYLHMHALVALHGQPGWVAVLTPLSVDGMIVAASTTLLAESRSGGRGGVLPWALLVIGSIASLAANVAVAEPMRQVRRAASRDLGRAVKSAQRGRAGHRRHAVSCPAAEAVGQARAESGCAAASVAVGGGEPGYGRFAAEREGDRGPVRPA